MAGKLHKDYEKYRDGGGQDMSPYGRKPRAYAEGYNAARKGAAQGTNPHGALADNVDDAARAWDQGWRDADAGHPSTHVGGPTPAPAAEPEPEPEEAAWRFMVRHADLDGYAVEAELETPGGWVDWTIAQKKAWLENNG